jgi:dipeptidyl aminopeptidase/acylaminoacyl peptidase
MDAAIAEYDVVGLGIEFRQSGFDSNPVQGSGWDCPYDLSFYQLFDVLNGLRELLALRSGINRRRLFHYGGSQGGHLALLSAVFAPRTFAAVYSSCGGVFVDEAFLEWAGREFLPHERAVRSVLDQASLIRSPVFLDHGTQDAEVSCDAHTRALERLLAGLGRPAAAAVYYEGATHSLAPVTSRVEAFRAMAPRFLALVNPEEDDLAAGRSIVVPCADRRLVVDWSQPSASAKLFRWESLSSR